MNAQQVKKILKTKDFTDKIVMGIDASSTMVGVCLMKNGDIIKTDHIDISKIDSLYEKVKVVVDWMCVNEADLYILEDRMKTFNSRTTAETLMKLAYVNSCIQYNICLNHGEDVLYTIHPSTARKHAWGKGRFNDVKNDIIKLCIETYNIEFPLKRKPSKNFVDWAGDVADSITLAKAFSSPIRIK